MNPICIFDTETTSLDNPFCYNIGYIIVDIENDNTLVRRDFVVEQVWHNLPLLESAYYAKKRPLYVNRMRARLATLDSLPVCCSESGECLQKSRQIFEAKGVFEPRMIDGIVKSLKSFDDNDLHERAKADPNLMKELVEKYFYCG